MKARFLVGTVLLMSVWAAAEVPDSDPRVTSVVKAYRKVRPAVVNIVTEQVVNARMGLTGDDIFDEMFPSPFVRRVPVQSLGSGFVIHPAGYVITNAHVVRRAEKIEVVLADGTRHPARIVSASEPYDLAVLKVDPNGGAALPFLPLGRSDDLMVGEPVIAVGNPFGYSNTVSTGIISAIGRDLEFENGVRMSSLIQTDAPINPGNSGGPLLNIHGELVGITTAIRAGAQNIGFAIPVNSLAAELTELMDSERLNRVVLGASVAQVRASTGAEVRVTAVRPGTPAEGKLLKGDRVLAVGGARVEQVPDFTCSMLAARAGQTLRLRVQRAGKELDVEVLLAAKPLPDGRLLGEGLLGMTLRPVTADLAKEMRLAVDRGLVVTELAPAGPAARLGMQKRDVLLQVDRFLVLSLDDLGRILEDVKGGQVLRVRIIRGNTSIWTGIQTRTPSSRPASGPTLPAGGPQALVVAQPFQAVHAQARKSASGEIRRGEPVPPNRSAGGPFQASPPCSELAAKPGRNRQRPQAGGAIA